ncbi:MAG: TonB-dependent receptor [Syntrophorhabdus aromaticivorans]|uniref:TonB-dependent receptor n=1 Tax=Syntrophorhabdus aromaticivorans TaxID=328301 RepID=A0A971M7H0_9BACT|nr:TonB-dependent receptor [Syntrophorhabdus aromaticivorans]
MVTRIAFCLAVFLCFVPIFGFCEEKGESITLGEGVVKGGQQEEKSETKMTLDPITVTDKGEASQDKTSIGSRTVVTREKIQTFNNFGMTNVYQSISLEPGVDVRVSDPTGTNSSYKIRGRSSRGQAVILEGLPFKGIGIGQPISDLVDMENIETITVEKGAIPATGQFGFGNLIDMRLQRPLSKFSFTAKQTFGSNDFSKTFGRLDSGELGLGIKAFISGSMTETDKFKGPGKGMDRDNFAFGITGGSPNGVEWEIFGIHNDEKRDKYKGLTYAQSTDLHSNWRLDYNPVKTGIASNDISYYAYNREDYRTSTILGKLKIPFGHDDALTFRPYFTNDSGKSWSGSSSAMVNFKQQTNVIVESLLDRDTFGAVLEYEKKWKYSRFNIGYWYGEHEPPGPPTARKVRDTNLNFIGWANLYRVEDRYGYRAPYAAFSKTLGKTVVDAGLKHMSISSAKFVSYNTTGVGDVSYNQAIKQAGSVDFTLPANTYRLWLPSIGATHYLSETSSIKASYGKNFDWPEFGWASSAISYFKQLGYNEQKLQHLWETRIRPPESDDFDLDYHYSCDRFAFTSSLYYKRLKYISTSIYDPTVNLAYSQNSGEGRAYGVELGSSYKVLDNLTVNLALSYNNTSFTSDVQTGVSTTVAAKGKQLPDRPKFYGNISAVYDLYGFKIAPVVRYLGKRYADVLNKYSVGDTWLADLSVRKDITICGGQKLQFALSVMNLLDKKYISTISTSDVNTNQGAPTYLVGPTRSVFGSVQYRF